MRINNISNIQLFKNNNYNFNSKQLTTECKTQEITPNYAYFTSFMGGSSLNLKESVKNLNLTSDFEGEKFPKDIYEMAQNVVDEGNSEDLTLIDIHKSKYQDLNACYNLQEAKELFPEFEEVLPDYKVDYLNNSFIDRVKKGEYDNFNKDEDLAFQLLKLYWAEGFSLTDLKEEAGLDLYHTMKKFNIPLMDRDYAHILKFSDKDYNKRFTDKMAQKRLETRDRKEMEKTGEPIYIPRGPLSETHKKHISEGLIKHYLEHPEKLSQMSERQIEYYENNPEQKELMQEAMNFAWNTQEGRSIKKYMSKFFKKEGIEFDEKMLENNFGKQNKALKKFWDKNPWAKGQFSTAMKKGWDKAKAVRQEIDFANADKDYQSYIKVTRIMIAEKYIEQAIDWAKKKGIDTSKIDLEKIKNFDPDARNIYEFNKIAEGFLKTNKKIEDYIPSAVQCAFVKLMADYIKGTNNEIKKHDFFYKNILEMTAKTFYGDSKLSNAYITLPKIMTTEDMKKLLYITLNIAEEFGYDDFGKYINGIIGKNYETMLIEDKEKSLEALRQYMFN